MLCFWIHVHWERHRQRGWENSIQCFSDENEWPSLCLINPPWKHTGLPLQLHDTLSQAHTHHITIQSAMKFQPECLITHTHTVPEHASDSSKKYYNMHVGREYTANTERQKQTDRNLFCWYDLHSRNEWLNIWKMDGVDKRQIKADRQLSPLRKRC